MGLEMEESRPTAEDEAEALTLCLSCRMPVKNDLDLIERAALDRLLEVAYRPTGQGRVVASFLLAWWNAEECGAFDLTDLWVLDKAIGDEMCRIFRAIASMCKYPDRLGYEKQFNRLVREWRPKLLENNGSER